MKVLHTLSLASICISLNANAASITIDGNLSDWGLHRNGNSADWLPNSSLVPSSQYTVEDQTGNSGTRLFPGYGGQAYDAEAFYITMDATYLYLALITGLSPNTPNDPAHNSYGPGDFAIDFGRDGTFEFGVETTGSQAGSVFRVSAWDYGLWDTNGNYDPNHPDLSHPTSIKTGTLVSSAGQLIYNSNPFKNMGIYTNDNHYAIEAAIPLIAFSGFSGKFDVQWTMNCANDAILVDPNLATVPEPNSLLLLSAGILGLFSIGRKNSSWPSKYGFVPAS
jgi:hypothetical protein